MEYLRSKPYAATFFKADGGQNTMLSEIPRYKFMFYANFVASKDALARHPEYKNLGNWEDGISFKIHTIDKPRVDLNITELNQYNRRRYAYTKTEYQPFTVKIYDTSDDRPLKLWFNYFTYYFGDSRPKPSAETYNQQVIADKFDYSTGWGLRPLGERLNFFDRVELYAIFGGRYTQINYINPKIVSVDWQNYETSASDPSEFSMTMRYEAIEYKAFGKMLTTSDEERFGFDIEPPLEPEGVLYPVDSIEAWAPSLDIYSLLGEMISGLGSMLPTDLMQGISASFGIANSTLNLFNAYNLNTTSMYPGTVIGQANQMIAVANGALALGQNVVNLAAGAGFLGSGPAGATSLPNPAGSTLGSFGSFNFGDSSSTAQGTGVVNNDQGISASQILSQSTGLEVANSSNSQFTGVVNNENNQSLSQMLASNENTGNAPMTGVVSNDTGQSVSQMLGNNNNELSVDTGSSSTSSGLGDWGSMGSGDSLFA